MVKGWSAETVPPEAILTSSTHPGSCWPMKGCKGQVTIRLPYPVKVKAVTIAHASSLLVDVSSAPKIIRVVAYPPCSDCQGMGFDVNDAWELTSLEYNAQGRSMQTFEIPSAAGSCSEEALSCSAEPESLGKLHVASQQDMAAAGITVAILDNWGVDDYTCLYRFRVHGDVAKT
jgi:SUN domain-containing protein 1/2